MDSQATPLETQEPQSNDNQNFIDPKLQEARERERLRLSREEKLRNELEQTRLEYEKLEQARQALISNGWDIDTLLTVKNGQSVETTSPVIEELKKQINDLKNNLTAKEQEQLNEKRRREASSFVKENEDRFELIKAHELEGEIVSLIDTHYKKTKKLLSYEEAAEKIEQHLEAETERLLNKVKSTKKIKKVLGDVSAKDIEVSKSAGVSVKQIEKVIDSTEKEVLDLKETVKARYQSMPKKVSETPKRSGVSKLSAREQKLEDLMKKYS